MFATLSSLRAYSCRWTRADLLTIQSLTPLREELYKGINPPTNCLLFSSWPSSAFLDGGPGGMSAIRESPLERGKWNAEGLSRRIDRIVGEIAVPSGREKDDAFGGGLERDETTWCRGRRGWKRWGRSGGFRVAPWLLRAASASASSSRWPSSSPAKAAATRSYTQQRLKAASGARSSPPSAVARLSTWVPSVPVASRRTSFRAIA